MPTSASSPDTTVTLDLLGVRAVLGGTDPDVAGLVRRLWAPFLVEDTGGSATPPLLQVERHGATWQVTGPDGTSTTPAPEQVLSTIATTFNRHALEGTPHFAAHAAVVAGGDRCVALVATSGTGKSTLTAALLQLGVGYVSDEALCLDADGAVVPYPRPLGLLPWTRRALGVPARWSAEEETQVSAAELGAAAVGSPPPVTDVVLLRREEGQPSALRPAARQQAAGELLRRSFNHHRDPARAFRLVHEVLASSRAWEMTVGPPRAAAALVVSELDLHGAG